MNRLEIPQAKELLAMGFYDAGVYTIVEDLQTLQIMSDFGTMSVMMARAMRPILPEEINPDYLEMAVSLQVSGENILYTCMQSLLWVGEESGEALNKRLFKLIRYELHPDISAMCAANFRAPLEIIEALQTHHDSVNKVTPLCAAFKMVNTFTQRCLDPQWRSVLSVNIVKDVLRNFPQLRNIRPEEIFEILEKMYLVKDKFFERSSAFVASSTFKRDSKYALVRPTFTDDDVEEKKSSDVRLDSDFLKALCIPAMEYANALVKEVTSPRRLEKMPDFLERIRLFHLRRAYAQRRDLQVLANDFNMSEEEITKLLNIKE